MLSFLLSRKLIKSGNHLGPFMDEALSNEEKEEEKDELLVPIKYPEEIVAKRQLNVINVDVIIIDTSNLLLKHTITCVMEYDLRLFVHQMNLVKDLGPLLENEPVYKAQANEICIVKVAHESKTIWYRAKVLTNLPRGLKKVKLIDYGTDFIVKEQNIREINEFAQFDILTFECFIAQVKNSSVLKRMCKAKAMSVKKLDGDGDHEIIFDWSSFHYETN